MLRLCLAAALIFQATPAQEEADKAAADLLKKLEDRITKAKTLHIEFEAAVEGRDDKLKGEIRIGENGSFQVSVKASDTRGGNQEWSMRSDGRTINLGGTRVLRDSSKWKPETVQRLLRSAATKANFLAMILTSGRDTEPEGALEQFTPKNVKSGGKEKIGEVEASVVTFDLEIKEGPMSQLMGFKLLVDPAKLNILKRVMSMGPMAITETTSKFELDPVFPPDFFELQNAAMFLEGRTAQLAASVLLHARYTGRVPKSLEDLKRRPADLPASVFWPEAGFWIGGAIPKDIPYSSDASHFTVGSIKEQIPVYSPVGAPTDRLNKHFEARIRIQLLKAAAEGFRKSTSSLPKDAQDLVKKPEAARYWPEGGWIGGSLPADPWGDPFVIRTEGSFTVTVAKSKGRVLKLAELTADERRGLDLVARPALPPKEAEEVAALIRLLGAEKLSERETATKSILAKGGGALHVVVDALAKEKDPEIMSRLGLIRDQFRSSKPTWELEVKGWRTVIAGAGAGDIASNERNGSVTLKTLTTAQADFRSNDRDGNRVCDFYVRDVAGLYALKGAQGKETDAKPGQEGDSAVIMKLIEPAVAKADATEDKWEYPVLGGPEMEPKSGYLFAVLKSYEEGEVKSYHDGSGRNTDRFGFVAYPAEYGVSGKLTFLVNEDNTIWCKDVGEEMIETFPASPAAAGWRKMD